MEDTLTSAAPYTTPQAATAAIRDLARRTDWGGSQDTNRKIQAILHDRFLSRVFTAPDIKDRWLLKGGFGILARIPDARYTRDIDMLSSEHDFDNARRDLMRAATTDLGDHLTFRLVRASSKRSEEAGGAGSAQFDCFAGTKKLGTISIDLAFNRRTPTGAITSQTSQMLPRGSHFISAPYRLFPVTDQIADKVCAIMRSYAPNTHPSSREKDLLDIALLLRHSQIDAGELATAIRSEQVFRGLPHFDRLRIPDNWGARYKQHLREISIDTTGLEDVAAAARYVATQLDPILSGTISAGTWSDRTGWVHSELPLPPQLSSSNASGEYCGAPTQHGGACQRRGRCPYHSR